MTNFAINFSIPWLLLLLIPAVVLTLWPYFRLAKRYRRTRNRIISIVLHLLIMVMSISLLAGMTFTYDIPNEENEIVIVVDMSHSSVEDHVDSNNRFAEKTEFVRDVLEESDSLYKVGVVAFGYKPVTVVEPTFEWEEAYETFVMFADEQATEEYKVIDETASDLSAALQHAASIVAKKDGAKLLVVTDGIQTDGDALSTVQRLAAEGVKVDVASFGKDAEPDVQIINVEMPDDNIKLGETFEIKITLQSSLEGDAVLTVSDLEMAEHDFNYQPVTHTVNLIKDEIEFTIQHKFESLMGMHRLRFDITHQDDTYTENNEYYAFAYLQRFDKVLMLEGFSGEAASIKDSLIRSNEYSEEGITIVNINPQNGNFAAVPKTVDELRNYDQVILVNVANSDLLNSNPEADAPNYNAALESNFMPVGFDEMLNDYVELYGGGMLYIGGNEPGTEKTPHAFDDVDINYKVNEDKTTDESTVYHTALKEMLPVDVVQYTPPIAVMLIIDRSNSMLGSVNGKTYLDWAKDAAKECLSALSYRDYMGTMVFADNYESAAPISSVLERQTILAQIDTIQAGGGTAYAAAVRRAGEALSAIGDDKVAERHVIIVSDGDPNDAAYNDGDGWADIIDTYYNGPAKVTYSLLDISGSHKGNLADIFNDENSGGIYETVAAGELPQLPQLIRSQIETDEIASYVNEEFVPAVQLLNSGVLTGLNSENIADMPKLTGYYGTRAKGEATTVLRAPYVPFYSEWRFGEGRVGAIMVNFNETNKSFLDSFTGRTIMSNIVTGLMPSGDIRPKDINVTLTEENYNTRVSVATSIEANQKVRITVTALSRVNEGDYTPQVIELSEADGFSRANVEITDPGIHSLLVEKYSYNSQGQLEVHAATTVYKTFSYSKEYDMFVDQTTVDEFIVELADKGRGTVVDRLDEDGIPNIFRDFDAGVSKMFDPRYLFMILAIIFFLLDVAVRKFKFKWPHEIIRDYKERKKLAK